MAPWKQLLEPYFMEQWHEQSTHGQPPDVLVQALKRMLGTEFKAEFVHPLDYDDDRIGFLIFVDADNVVLARFQPPALTISYLGSLAGGRYDETVAPRELLKGTFTHRRLGEHGPLRVTYRPPAETQAGPSPDAPRMFVNSNVLRERLYDWSLR